MLKLSSTFNFATTFQHPLGARKVIEFVPTDWIKALANPDVGDLTDLTTTTDEELVSLETLWKDMLEKGMRDPFILCVGRHTRQSRLEAGNHRVKMFLLHNEAYVPATVLVADDCVIKEGNGSHRFTRDLLIPSQEFSHHGYDDRIYQAPSTVFKDIADLKSQGLIPASPHFS